MEIDKNTEYLLVGMLFCLIGCIGVYSVTGITGYLFIGVSFVIVTCSIVVSIATHLTNYQN